jgi:hypothetical protein
MLPWQSPFSEPDFPRLLEAVLAGERIECVAVYVDPMASIDGFRASPTGHLSEPALLIA